ncbi:MAG: carbohydrate ABC transporter permease, partial [Anaerolineae bacterium]|nr:carbohydrate ABC transporter permease [Anaerolineae bacterium]
MAETTIAVSPGGNITSRLAKPVNWGKIFTYAILLFGVVLMIFPFLWMVSASLMSLTEVTFGKLLPSTPLFSNYAEAFQRANFGQFMWNSVRLTAITLTGQMLVCIPAAYAFARMRFVGRNVLFTLMLATIMIPEVARFIPNYLTVIWLGRLSDSLLGIPWVNNWPSLTIPFMAVPFTIFLLRQFFMQLPEDLWDAARIDGAGHIRFLRSVVIPLSTAPIMTAITFGFIGSWNSLLWPLLLTQTDEWRPVAVGLTKFVNSDAPTELHLQMAAAVLMIIP